MAIAPRNSRRSSIDIWPGFVDALAQLLMVIIFILLVFTAGQFYLSEALSGRDQALQRLQQQVNELGDLLAMERRATADLRVSAADVSAQLASSQAERDRLTGQLRDADATVSADKEKVELQLREIESLRRDLDALKSVRADLEAKIAALAQQQAPKELGRCATAPRNSSLACRRAGKDGSCAKGDRRRDVRLRDVGSPPIEPKRGSQLRKRSAATPLPVSISSTHSSARCAISCRASRLPSKSLKQKSRSNRARSLSSASASIWRS
jgi:chemotaxis protein MotB